MNTHQELGKKDFIKSPLYFPNLNGLRFIAAFLVLIHHVEQFKELFNIKNIYQNATISLIGILGVNLFFVLSGFLITYLLLVEKKLTNNVNIKKFYVRRMLRIWPLYYLVIILSLFVLPQFEMFYVPGWSETLHDNFWIKAVFFLLFLPHVAKVIYPAVAFAVPSWTIGVEEQFYALWPHLIKKSKNVLRILVKVIGIYILIKFLILGIRRFVLDNEILTNISAYWIDSSIDSMAIGGLGAYFLFTNNTRVLTFLFHPISQVVIYATTFLFIFDGTYFRFGLNNEVYSFCFSIIILNLAANKKTIFSLENPFLNYLGKISYGLYLLHEIAIVFTLNVLASRFGNNNLLIYLCSISITVLLAILSYEFFEKKFIKLKVGFASLQPEMFKEPATKKPHLMARAEINSKNSFRKSKVQPHQVV